MTCRAVTIGIWVFVVVFGAPPCVPAQIPNTAPPPLEVGAVVSRFPGDGPVGLGLRLTVAGRGRVAFEAAADWTELVRAQRYVDQVMWFYYWQVKHTVWSEANSTIFATYGTAGGGCAGPAPGGR